MTRAQRNDLVMENLDLAKLVAALLAARLPRGVSVREELEGEGRLQLVIAADEYNEDLGVPFRLWAKRFLLWRVTELLRRRHLRESLNEPLAEGYDEAGPPTQEAELLRKQMEGQVWEHVGRLPQVERRVLTLHYRRGHSITQIGERLGVSESRASQVHVATLRRLRLHGGLKRLAEAA